MRVNIDRMINKTEGVNTVTGLVALLNEKGIPVCERTIYRWKRSGIGFNENKVKAAAEALKLKPEEIISIA